MEMVLEDVWMASRQACDRSPQSWSELRVSIAVGSVRPTTNRNDPSSEQIVAVLNIERGTILVSMIKSLPRASENNVTGERKRARETDCEADICKPWKNFCGLE